MKYEARLDMLLDSILQHAAHARRDNRMCLAAAYTLCMDDVNPHTNLLDEEYIPSDDK